MAKPIDESQLFSVTFSGTTALKLLKDAAQYLEEHNMAIGYYYGEGILFGTNDSGGLTLALIFNTDADNDPRSKQDAD